MKKSILGLAVSALFMVGTAHAVSTDQSATLTVSGSVTANESVCAVTVGQSAVTLNADISNLPAQGAIAMPANSVDLAITGDEQCQTLLSQGQMAYRFLGTADNADGNVLQNTATGTDAASGVGIGLYTLDGGVLPINSSKMNATTSNDKLGLRVVKLSNGTPLAGKIQGSLTIQIERL